MPTTSRPVAVVTDSTAGLPSELIDAHDLSVVPLTVTIDSASGREGVDVSPEDLPLPFPDALQEFKVETSGLAAQYGHHVPTVAG